MSERHWHLISYDVRDDKRRRRTAKFLEGQGDRVQFSVFRLYVSRRQLLQVRLELQRRMEDPDSLLIIPIPDAVARNLPRLHESEDWTDAAPRWRIVG
jgi:CRISPR-associated protein Cas2